MTRALLLENPHDVADDIFAKFGIEVTRVTGALSEDDLIDALEGVDYLGLRSKTEVTERVLRARPGLKAIGAFCIGTNQIDLATATEMGVAVFNAPYSNTRSVVELAIGEIIDLSRRVTVKNSRLHRGVWDKSADGAHFYDAAERLSLGNATQMPTMEAVLREADIISVHVDGQESNTNLIGRTEFELMKPGALFINLSRGHVVDVDALHAALVSGHLGGAAIDVFPEEPRANGDPFTSPLATLDNVILTPHIGGSTEEAQYDIGRFVAAKIGEYQASGSTDMSVNLPNLTMNIGKRSRYRVRLIHRNVPGVMARVNQIFASSEANVDAQILATMDEVGYVLTDISAGLGREALEELSHLPETIRLIATPL